MDRDRIIELNHEWLGRVAEVNRRYGTRSGDAESTLRVQMCINVAVFVLEEGITAENAEQWVVERIAEFEAKAREANPNPKASRRRKGGRPVTGERD